MVTVAQIKETLPNWPDLVVNEWLVYFANDIGWPPTEPLGADRWGSILGNRPLSWWARVEWTQDTVDCSRANLSTDTQQRIAAVSDPVYAGTASEAEKGQYRRPFQYLLEHGAFANRALAMRDGARLRFIDGHHRLAALTDLLENADDAFFVSPAASGRRLHSPFGSARILTASCHSPKEHRRIRLASRGEPREHRPLICRVCQAPTANHGKETSRNWRALLSDKRKG